MEKIKVYSLEGEVVDEIELPEIFTEEYRPGEQTQGQV